MNRERQGEPKFEQSSSTDETPAENVKPEDQQGPVDSGKMTNKEWLEELKKRNQKKVDEMKSEGQQKDEDYLKKQREERDKRAKEYLDKTRREDEERRRKKQEDDEKRRQEADEREKLRQQEQEKRNRERKEQENERKRQEEERREQKRREKEDRERQEEERKKREGDEENERKRKEREQKEREPKKTPGESNPGKKDFDTENIIAEMGLTVDEYRILIRDGALSEPNLRDLIDRIFGVSPDDREAVKKAFRENVRGFHSDLSGDNQTQGFKSNDLKYTIIVKLWEQYNRIYGEK